ncbi:MAG: hypothetical protein ACU0DI_05390 [Paracoccaceae bacterium]
MEDYAKFFGAIERIRHEAAAALDLRRNQVAATLSNLAVVNTRNEPLIVSKIQFGSPGFTDLAGAGAVLREVRLFVQYIIDHCSSKKERNLAIQSKQIKNANLMFELAEKIEASNSPNDIGVQLIKQFLNRPELQNIISAVVDKRIISVEESNEDQE